MNNSTRLLIAAVLLTAPTLVTLAQINIAPPTTGPATMPETAPATKPASTLPSAQTVLENLLSNPSHGPAAAPLPPPPTTNPDLTHAVPPVAPNAPKASRIIEGRILEGTGHLTKDDKSGDYIFTFDSDGKKMTDPPITLLPSLKLESMAKLLENTLQQPKFKISGEVTEFKGKNYLYLRDVRVLKDLNQGLGG